MRTNMQRARRYIAVLLLLILIMDMFSPVLAFGAEESPEDSYIDIMSDPEPEPESEPGDISSLTEAGGIEITSFGGESSAMTDWYTEADYEPLGILGKADITGRCQPDPDDAAVLVDTVTEGALWRLEYEGGYLEAFNLEGYPNAQGRDRFRLTATAKSGFIVGSVPIQTRSKTGSWGTSAFTTASSQVTHDNKNAAGENTSNITANRYFRANFLKLWKSPPSDWKAANGDTFDDFVLVSEDGVNIGAAGYFGAGGAVEIPEGITEIGESAFRRNYNLGGVGTTPDVSITSLKLPDSLVSIGASAFRDTDLTGELILPPNLITVGDYAFYGAGTGDFSLVISESVTTIGLRAFNAGETPGRGIGDDLVIPSSVTSIGETAFSGTRITSVTFPAEESPDPNNPSILTMSWSPFTNCLDLEVVQGDRHIQWSMVSFGSAARLMNLRTIDLPNLSGALGDGSIYPALGGSPALTELSIPKGITGIDGGYGFFAGTNIREAIFPSNCISFGNDTMLGGKDTTTINNYPDSQLEYAAILAHGVENAYTGLLTASPTFQQRPAGTGTYPGEEKFKAVYVYPGTTTETTVLANKYLGAQKVRYLTRTVQATVQDPDKAGFSFSDEITVAWDDWNTREGAGGDAEDVFPSFEPTVLDAWAKLKQENGELPEFSTFTLDGVRYTHDQAGSTALPEGAVLRFIPEDMILPWFEYDGAERQAVDIATGIDFVLTLMSEAGPVADMPLYLVDTADGTMKPLGLRTDAQGRFTLNLEEGTYIITPYDTSCSAAFNFLTVTVSRGARLGGLTGAGTPAFGGEAVLGTDFAAGTLTKAGELTPVTKFDPSHVKYDFYTNKETTAVTFTVRPQLPEIAADMRLTVSGTDMTGAAPAGGTWTVTVPLTGTVTQVTFAVYDTETGKSGEYTVNIKRAVTWDGTAPTVNLSDALDMAMLSNAVGRGITFEGVIFKLTDDIELPAEWVPMGGGEVSDKPAETGRQVRPFSGTIDGAKSDGSGNHTITFAPGSRPLIRYARGAAVRNLNIYGTDINGHGLLENYFVDYGPQGSYSSWAQTGIGTLDVINFTILEGTNIRGSGITGGYASGINHINVINSVVEKGVKIGFNAETNASSGSSRVGSFGGDFNGTVVGSVSYADVYGVSNVGGLVGSKGQSMGPCDITNSAFHGTVEATGSYVGGILGAGYYADSAPNTPAASIENSYVTGTVNGGNYVGGILGGEGGLMQCWDNGIGYIRNNYFAGTIVSSGANVGGIIGYMNSLNRYNITSNNYYLEGHGASKGIGRVKIIDTSYSSPAAVSGVRYVNTAIDDPSDLGPDDPSFGSAKRNHDRSDDPLGADADRLAMSVTAEQLSNEAADWLNAGEGSLGNWIQGTEGYPVHDSSAITIRSISLSGNYKTDYYVNEPADYTGLVINIVFSDGSTGKLDWNSGGVTFYGFDSSTEGPRMITVSYRGARAMYSVDVAVKPGRPANPGQAGESVNPDQSGRSDDPAVIQTAGTGGKGQTAKTDSSTADAVQQEILEKIRNTPDGGTLTIQPGEEFALTPDILSALKAKDMTVAVERGDCSISFHTSQITGTLKEGQEINFNVSSASENRDKIEKAFDGESIQLLHFDYHGELPVPVTVRIKISDELAGKTPLYLYYYNQDTGRLEQLDAEVLIEDGYAQFTITHCSDYVLSGTSLKIGADTKEEIKTAGISGESGENNRSSIPLVIGAAIILVAAAAAGIGISYKRKKARKESK